MPLLECVGLVKRYEHAIALVGVDFHVDQEEIVALVGHEGAGKTTAYEVLCGLQSPTSGRVLFNGIDITRWMPSQRQRAGIRFVAEGMSVHRAMTVEDAFFNASQSLNMNAERRRSQVDDLLTKFGLNWTRSELVGNLSFGERTRLAIATCLVGEPALLCLDEPFEATDVVITHAIEDILSELPSKGISVLLTDRRGRQILPIAHRTYLLRNGGVVVSGDAETVLSNLDARRDYFGDDGFPRRY